MKASLSLAIFLSVTLRLSAQIASADLIEKAKELDGVTVDFSGEVIGDAMARGDHVWINLSDGANAIGVWLPRGLLSSIRYLGSYGVRGDTLRVRGVFHKDCPDHGGDMDIHASAVFVVSEGAPVRHEIKAARIIAAAALLPASLAAFLWWRRRERVQTPEGWPPPLREF
jgi:hypothetical protein